MTPPNTLAAPALTPGRERALLWLLALTQFTIVVDFMVMMPLGPQIMHAFSIGPAAFAAAVLLSSALAVSLIALTVLALIP